MSMLALLRQMALLFIIGLSVSSCAQSTEQGQTTTQGADNSSADTIEVSFTARLAAAALELTQDEVSYDPSYFSIAYPGGDVPAHLGVCTDVVIRAFRKLGIDLQEAVHEDMAANFQLYPSHWGLKQPDTNIDHRRVPNLMTYFERKGAAVPISTEGSDYLPGDIVCWQLSGGLTHIGIVSDAISTWSGNPKIIHNIGAGQVLQDCLFDYEIFGHYRFEGE